MKNEKYLDAHWHLEAYFQSQTLHCVTYTNLLIATKRVCQNPVSYPISDWWEDIFSWVLYYLLTNACSE